MEIFTLLEIKKAGELTTLDAIEREIILPRLSEINLKIGKEIEPRKLAEHLKFLTTKMQIILC